MDFYKIKSTNPADYMTIVREMEDGFIVKIVRNRDGYEEVITDFLSKTLFESCLRTGYIEKVTSVRKLAVNA
ncbi:MAG: hypothetical protein SPE30_09660 [Candidatus Treponema excrementipullorum]|nr:hypothetical protein [Spirochaetia bacterium]MDD7011414.1 hypothetical protein [Candidatus Treponema excrementipullorum]MCI6953347.1 hypothetical protein [Spirochaetia bacterium]MCI7588423.1 hypothetical protein [Spirochaetia bacterium]MDY2756058.1 hypothetical protein [Candidatus Treponema excrementipullorum]